MIVFLTSFMIVVKIYLIIKHLSFYALCNKFRTYSFLVLYIGCYECLVSVFIRKKYMLSCVIAYMHIVCIFHIFDSTFIVFFLLVFALHSLVLLSLWAINKGTSYLFS